MTPAGEAKFNNEGNQQRNETQSMYEIHYRTPIASKVCEYDAETNVEEMPR
jgi:hypothetical protein